MNNILQTKTEKFTMLPRVDFYLLDQETLDAPLHMVCRISEKAYKQQHQLFIQCADNAQAQALDKLLWTFKDISFIPHALWNNQNTVEAPIMISGNLQSPPAHYHDILVNLTSNVPSFALQFQRLIEVVSANACHRQLARERFRIYREQGFTLHSHQIK